MARSVPAQVDDWAIVGSPTDVAETIATYRRELGMTHLIATRLRMGAIPRTEIEQSLRMLAELDRLS
jgi:alkanesulfonate monooxygenase SsuD/methylene tetrahydromethanopterin reductase-like flavin-dependent oxidoreductase (luciferase family)